MDQIALPPVAGPSPRRAVARRAARLALVLGVLIPAALPATAAAASPSIPALAALAEAPAALVDQVAPAVLALQLEIDGNALLPAGPRIAAIPGAVTPAIKPSFDPKDPPFHVRHFALKDLRLNQLFPEPRGKTSLQFKGPHDADGVPMSKKDGVAYYSPTGIAIEALRRLWVYTDTDDPAYLDVAKAWATKLRTLMRADLDGTLWLPYTWNDRDQKLKAPWYNALGQGSALALYTRLYRVTGEEHWLETADGLFGSFLKLGPSTTRPWVAQVSKGGDLWLEHYPNGVRGHVLNAHLYAAFGLRDYWQAVRHDPTRAHTLPLARLMTEAAFTTIREQGGKFRRPGTWSWYNLVHPVANRQYHLFHIRELKAAQTATGDPWFGALARAFESDYLP
ncbi:MAG: D-glucuronyl C5-epimerase family protein [Chloroflexota bacterium]